MFEFNMTVLSMLLGTVFPLLDSNARLANAMQQTTSPITDPFGQIIAAAFANAEKIGIGVGFVIMCAVVWRLLGSQDQRDKNSSDSDKRQMELMAQSLQVGSGVVQTVDKLDAAIDSIASVGKGFQPLVDQIQGLLKRMDDRELAAAEEIKKASADTYLGLSAIQQLIETLPTKLALPALGEPTDVEVRRGIVLSDAQGKVISINEYALELLSLKKEDALGKYFYDIGQITLDPNTLRIVSKDERPVSLAMQTKVPIKDMLFGFFNEDQEQFHWFLLDIYPRLVAGEITGMMLKFISVGQLLNFANTETGTGK